MAGSIRKISSNDEDYIYGWILNDDCSFSESTCLISEEDGGLQVTVPFDGSNQEILSWFVGPEDWPFFLERGGNPPKTLFVKNVKSSDCYTLMDSRVVHRSTKNMPKLEPHGEGVIIPKYIVRGGAGVDYSRINCMRSIYRELLEWTGLRSLKTERSYHTTNQAC